LLFKSTMYLMLCMRTMAIRILIYMTDRQPLKTFITLKPEGILCLEF